MLPFPEADEAMEVIKLHKLLGSKLVMPVDRTTYPQLAIARIGALSTVDTSTAFHEKVPAKTISFV
jgi:hypothetical protein